VSVGLRQAVVQDKQPKPLPEGWRMLRLGEVCELNPRRPPDIARVDGDLTTFVPMQAVDERLGSICSSELRPFAQVRKGYTYFAEGDVLFAKITPCMQNGKHAIARDLYARPQIIAHLCKICFHVRHESADNC
jgi:type I restriction enzyme S subunit